MSSLKATELIKSYEKYGDDCIMIDLDNIRTNDQKNWYCDLKLKHPETEEYILGIHKIINVTVGGRQKLPDERLYEGIKVSTRLNDILNPESKLGESLKIICEVFKRKIKELVKKKVITDDDDELNIKYRFPSIKPKIPMQITAPNKEKVLVQLENPIFWFNLNTKRYTKAEEQELSIYNDITYKGKDPKPFRIKPFEINICDLNKKKENYEKGESPFELATDNNGNSLDTTNIHEFLTSQSIISGSLKFKIVISKSGGINLKFDFYKTLYVMKGNYNSNQNDNLDDDDFSEMDSFVSQMANTTKNLKINDDDKTDEIKTTTEQESDDELSESDDEQI